MDEPIISKKPKKRPKKGGRFKQLGLILFTLIVMAVIIFVSYKYFFPEEEDFVLDFYTYATVDHRDFLDSLSASGTIRPELIIEIEADVAAEVAGIHITDGQDVQAGEPIISLYSQSLYENHDKALQELRQSQQALDQLLIDHEYDLASAERKVAEAQYQVESHQTNYELQSKLFEYGTIARVEFEKAAQELDNAKHNLALAQRDLDIEIRTQANALEQAENSVVAAEEELELLEDKIENLTIRAPISGRILALDVSTGTRVQEGTVLAEIADLSSQYVELDVSATQAERFTTGSQADITISQVNYSATVTYIAPQARQTQDGSLVRITLNLDEDPSHLRPYSNASVNIHLGIYRDSLYLPRGAYLTSGQQLFVYLIDGSRAVRKDVQFGMLQGNNIQILSGLDEGDQVIISSYDQYRHHDEIKLLPEGGREL